MKKIKEWKPLEWVIGAMAVVAERHKKRAITTRRSPITEALKETPLVEGFRGWTRTFKDWIKKQITEETELIEALYKISNVSLSKDFGNKNMTIAIFGYSKAEIEAETQVDRKEGITEDALTKYLGRQNNTSLLAIRNTMVSGFPHSAGTIKTRHDWSPLPKELPFPRGSKYRGYKKFDSETLRAQIHFIAERFQESQARISDAEQKIDEIFRVAKIDPTKTVKKKAQRNAIKGYTVFQKSNRSCDWRWISHAVRGWSEDWVDIFESPLQPFEKWIIYVTDGKYLYWESDGGSRC